MKYQEVKKQLFKKTYAHLLRELSVASEPRPLHASSLPAEPGRESTPNFVAKRPLTPALLLPWECRDISII